jgi:hypothetical protein
MIDKKLDELGKYSENLEKTDPIELIETFLNGLEKEVSSLTEEELMIGNWFGHEVIRSIDEHKKKGIVPNLVSYHLLSILVSYIKKTMVENKANTLGIEKNLFKQDMSLLFKGKYSYLE